MNKLVIKLTTSEYLQAGQVGLLRCVQNRSVDAQHKHGAEPKNAEQYSITGAVGEACVAKHLGVYWLGTGELGGSDVGGYEVRTTTMDNVGALMHKTDKEDAVYIAVHALEGVGTIMGWYVGRDAIREEYWGNHFKKNPPRPCCLFPKDKLQPMSTLPPPTKCEDTQI